MMYNYERNIVVAAYRATNPDDLDPKEKTLTDFDAGLFITYDQEIRKQAQERRIPLNLFTRSMLVFFASRTTVNALTERVADACDYFDSVRPQPSVIAGNSEVGLLASSNVQSQVELLEREARLELSETLGSAPSGRRRGRGSSSRR